ncbi:MAG: Flp pilus assembly protein CpaB [Hyphomicrobiaceae bacterium]|nr:Flp pilus assembly protein CpaB [Hyphomicrobiaceae bacterium]
MKRAQVVGISVALGAGALAFVGMRGLLKPQQATVVQTERVDVTQVLVARVDIPLGQVVHEGTFRWQDWPADAVGNSFITRTGRPGALKEHAGAISRAPILAGEPITENKMIRAGSGGVLAAILPPGMRAISTKITEHTAAGKLILPNDHVDVILIRRLRSRTSDEHVSDTLFRNVRVLAIGQQIEAREGKKGSEGNVATLELTPQQAEELALANSLGEITLSLRSVADLAAEGPSSSDGLDKPREDRGNAIGVLRYGVKSRDYGVN